MNYWFISDTHFNHTASLTFIDNEGKKMRPFSSVEEMNETMIENWNKFVKPQDKIYHLGDVIMGGNEGLHKILPRLNGKKRLILGNHDHHRIKELLPYFKKVSGVRHLNIGGFKCVLSHIPLHPDCIGRFGNLNIHGHLHCNDILCVKTGEAGTRWERVMWKGPDPRYKNVCVEKTGFKPINLEEIK